MASWRPRLLIPANLLRDWHHKAVIRRMFLPKDLMEEADITDTEVFYCRRRTVETLHTNVRERTRVVRRREAAQYSRDSQFSPSDFRSLTVTFIDNPKEVSCGGCSGRGRNHCPTTMWCRKCNGSSKHEEQCNSCGGTGKNPTSPEHGCGYCNGGNRTVDCRECDYGEVTCERCGGRGYTSCDKCDAEGILVQANFVTRQFRPSVKVFFRLPDLAENEFKHGLSKRHFNRIPGDQTGQRWVESQDRNTVMTRTTLHSYYVISQECTYQGKPFHLNRISTKRGESFVTSRLPLSKARTAAGVAVSFLVLFAAGVLGVAKLSAAFIVAVSALAAGGIVDTSFLD